MEEGALEVETERTSGDAMDVPEFPTGAVPEAVPEAVREAVSGVVSDVAVDVATEAAIEAEPAVAAPAATPVTTPVATPEATAEATTEATAVPEWAICRDSPPEFGAIGASVEELFRVESRDSRASFCE